MFSKFFPNELNFFDLFDKQVDYAVDASNYFKELMSKASISEQSLKKIGDIEHQGDEVSHDIFEHLNKTFITPFDREDIHALAKELDNITDMINTIVSRLWIYKLIARDENLVKFSSVISESVNAVARAVKGLRNMKDSKSIQEACIEINRLENVGDSMRDNMLVELFEKVKDPITVIKLKEIYQDAETVLDICEDVTHVVGAIILKQA
jgi:predicted phosphate transport protein (TIGR00153 family)